MQEKTTCITRRDFLGPKLVMAIGLPGSGKSTKLKELYPTFERLSTDDYVEALAASQGKTYGQVFEEGTKLSHTEMYLNLDKFVSENKNIVWDQTNLSVKTRKSKLAKIPWSYYKIAICFMTEGSITQRVNEERKAIGRDIPEHVFRSMVQSFEPPTFAEPFDEIIMITRKA